MVRFALILLVWLNSAAHAEEPFTYAEFREEVERNAGKVDLFSAAWERDPDAIIFGGTARDYAYYILHALRDAKSRDDFHRAQTKLRERATIEAREFIMRESDADILTFKMLGLRAEDFGVLRIDEISPLRIDPNTPFGRTEIDQGYIPVEKISLSQHGMVDLPWFGDGLLEVYHGHLSVHFTPPEVFYNTYYAKLLANHPILLALRYLRLFAMDEYNRFGRGVPQRTVKQLIPDSTEREMLTIFNRCLESRELDPYLGDERFVRRLNRLIHRTYRGYTNTTLANELMMHFHVNELPARYPKIKFLNNLLFAQEWDTQAVARALEEYKVNVEKFFSPIEVMFPGRRAYHGALNQSNVYSMLYQGVIPSAGGSAGHGHYVWNEPNSHRASEWRGSGKNVVVEELDPQAKIVDITTGEGARVHALFRGTEDQFAEAFGIDIIRYPYAPSSSVIKNSAVILSLRGLYYEVLTYDKAVEFFRNVTDAAELRSGLKQLAASRLSLFEKRLVMKALPFTLYSSSAISQHWFKGLDAGSALMLIEHIVDRVSLPKLFREAAATMSDTEFFRLIELSGVALGPDKIAADLLLDVFREFKEPAVWETFVPLMLARIGEPEIYEFFLQSLRQSGPRRESLRMGLIAAIAGNVDIGWPKTLTDAPDSGQLDWIGPDAMWIALSLVKQNLNVSWAANALFREVAALESHEGSPQFRLIARGQSLLPEFRTRRQRVRLAEALQQLASTTFRLGPPAKVVSSIFDFLRLLNNRKNTAELLSELDLTQTPTDHSADVTQMLLEYLAMQLMTMPADIGRTGLSVGQLRNLKWLKDVRPDVLVQGYVDPRMRKIYSIGSVLDSHVVRPDVGDVLHGLAHAKSPLVRLLAMLILSKNKISNATSDGAFLDVVEAAKFLKSKVRLERGTDLDVDEFVNVYRQFLLATASITQRSPETLARLRRLKALPLNFEGTETAIEFEALKILIILGQGDEAGLRARVFDRQATLDQRQAAARALTLQNPNPTPDWRRQFAAELRGRSFRRWRLPWQAPNPASAEDFFLRDKQIHFHLFRILKLLEPDFLDLLASQSRIGTAATLSPNQIAATLKELKVSDPRFLPFINRYLAKSGAKNMELFFSLLVQNYPERAKDILEALFVVRRIPEMFTAYVDQLKRRAIEHPGFIESLREVRLKKQIPLKSQVAIEGLFVDDWLTFNACAGQLERENEN